jgi:hypothetical protein
LQILETFPPEACSAFAAPRTGECIFHSCFPLPRQTNFSSVVELGAKIPALVLVIELTFQDFEVVAHVMAPTAS